MEQKHVLLSALSVGVGVGLGLASGQAVNKWTNAPEGITPEQIEKELRRLILDGKFTKITFDDFPYYLSERTRVLLTSAAYVHLNHLDVSKYTRNLSPASRAILLSGPAELYQQTLAKALAHHFDAKLLLLDLTDFSLKMQSKYGIFKKESAFKRSTSESTLGRLSSLLGSFSILSARETSGVTYSRQTVGVDSKSRNREGASNSLKHRRNASVSSDISSISSESSASNPAPIKRVNSWSLDEKAFLQSLFKVLVSISETSRVILYIRDVDRHLQSPRAYKLFDRMLKKLSGSALVLGSRMFEHEDECEEVDEKLRLLFPYNIDIRPPEDETHLTDWKTQLEEDMKMIQFQDNKNHIAEVLAANDLECDDLGSICHADTMVLSNYIEEIVISAISHHLMNSKDPEYRNGKLLISSNSLSHGLGVFQDGKSGCRGSLKMEANAELSKDAAMDDIGLKPESKSENPTSESKGEAPSTKKDGEISSASKAPEVIPDPGLYVHLRIGPYACAEWNFGGFPVWLKYVPGISFRTNNEPFKAAMQKFTTKIVDMMKAEKLYETQGGPIILSQIENEYGPMEWELGEPGKVYSEWAAKMAVDLGTGVPWIMCKQDDVPDPIINTCNGFYCDYFTPNKANKPKMWTEAWTAWFTEFGGPVPYRPAEDMAFAVARFIQTGGSFINYYMYHGGTNFGRTSGGPFIATSYDYDAPLDEFGSLRQPKWGHLKDLHRAIKLCEPALVSADPTVTSLGNYQEARVFKSESGACAAFLANYNQHSFAKVAFGNMHYNLPPWSISILPDCKNTVYNTARVGAQSAQMKMTPVSRGFSWESFNEDAASHEDDTFTVVGLLEQINITRDVSDYLWYMTDIEIDPTEGFLNSGNWPWLTVFSAGHALHVFVNGQLAGTVYGSLENPKLTFSNGINLRAGVNKISLLSIAVGLPNVGPHFETWNAGVLGPVSLNGLNEGTRDLTWQKWFYKVGLKGEALSLHSLSGSPSVEWVEGSLVAQKQPLSWYKTTFNAPDGNEPLALDMNTMGKGQVWINGQSLGRHWPAYKSSGSCSVCNYTGWFDEKKCLTNCGEGSQRWYHVPRSWLYPTGNLLVVFEEWGGDPYGITLVKREIGSVCADIYEWQPQLLNWQRLVSGKFDRPLRPKAHLKCAPGQKISSIKFASFGTPEGVCGNFQQGSCHAPRSYDAFKKNCVGKESCSVQVTPENFGGDPCRNVLKKLSVEAICS